MSVPREGVQWARENFHFISGIPAAWTSSCESMREGWLTQKKINIDGSVNENGDGSPRKECRASRR